MSRETNNNGQSIDLRALRIRQILDGENQDKQLVVDLQKQLRDAQSALKAKDRELGLKDGEITRLKVEASVRRSPEMPGDPDGYYKALGLHPAFAQGLTEEQAREVAHSAWRLYAKVFHTDNGGDLARMKRINAAHDYLAPRPEQPTIPKPKQNRK
jgi:hypothetical protein